MRKRVSGLAGIVLLVVTSAAEAADDTREYDTLFIPPLPNFYTTLGEAEFPPESLLAQEKGTAILNICIGADGRVNSAEITRSTGFDRLDNETFELVESEGRYTPAMRSGIAEAYCRNEIFVWDAGPKPEAPTTNFSPPPEVQPELPPSTANLPRSVIRVCVDESGTVDDVRVVETSGQIEIDQATLILVGTRFSYNPDTQGGAPGRFCQNQAVRWAVAPN